MCPRERQLLIVILAILVLILVGCDAVQVRGPGRKIPYEEFTLNTTDNVTIAISYYPSHADKGIILIHMLAKTRATYEDLALELVPYYKVVAIDLRGHGDSQGLFEDLKEKDFQAMPYDVEVAAAFLKQEGVAEKDISVVGASIGANLALLYANIHPVDKVVLISPGGRLRGLDISRIAYSKPLFVQVGYYDAYSSISVEELQQNWEKARVMVYESPAHGTDLLSYDLSAREDLLFYLS